MVEGFGYYHPQSFSVKTPSNSRRTSKIVQRASQALLRDRIHFHWRNKASQVQKIQELENFLKSSLINSGQQRIFTAVESSFRKTFNKQKRLIFVNFLFSIINRIGLPQYRPPTNLYSVIPNTFSQRRRTRSS
jgi:hypothetical protein